MKKSFLYLAFTVAACISGPALALSTTFAEYDEMTKDEQSTFISETGVTIYAWLKKNDPAKAQCMYEKFEIGKEKSNPSVALISLNRKIKGVPAEDRPDHHVENLMANYVIDDLCVNAVAPASADQPKPAAK